MRQSSDDGWVSVPDGEDFVMSIRIPKQEYVAEWDEKTGELTLTSRKDGVDRLVVWTKNPEAYAAAIRLLGPGSVVTFLGFMLTTGPWPVPEKA